MLAAVPKTVTTTTGGLTSTLATERTVSLNDLNNPLSLNTLTETVTVNGRTSTQAYDAATKTTITTTAANRKSTEVTDSQGRVTQSQVTGLLPINNSYDARGRLSTITQGTDPDTRTINFGYDAAGFLGSVSDPLGRIQSYEYDAAAQITRQTLPDGRVILYGYDVNGNLTSLTPPGRPAHVFNYTSVDLQGEYDPPLVTGSGNTLYTYNLDKELTRITRPDGGILDLAYDGAGRLSTLTVPTGDLAYAYGATSGKLTSITAPDGGTLSYLYSGALLTKTAWAGAVAGDVGFAYDNDFRITSIAVNGAEPIARQYDADSLLIKAGGLNLTRRADNGLLSGTSFGTISDSLSYNGFGEMTAYDASASGTALFASQYTRDKLGRITRKTETVGGVTTIFDYGYDLAGRLTGVKEGGVVRAAYTYDDNGNRLTGPGPSVPATYDDQDRLTQHGGTTYTYTGNGELASKTVGALVTTYRYDVLGNLEQVSQPTGGTIDYVIDGQNRRIGKKVNGTFVQGFLYQDQLKPIAELDGANNVVSRFVYATHANVPDSMVKGGVTYRILTDHLGSPRLVMKTTDGTIVQRMDYDEFGRVILDTNPNFQPFGFAGGLYDLDTTLVRFGARDYDSETGRWTAKDPILFRGGDTNLYGYIVNNPVNGLDIYGLKDGFDPTPYRRETDPYVVGREGSIIEPGKGAGAFIDDNVRAGHDLGVVHDNLVDALTQAGVPDSLANLPTMLPVYSLTNLYHSLPDIAKEIQCEQSKGRFGRQIRSTGDVTVPILTIRWQF